MIGSGIFIVSADNTRNVGSWLVDCSMAYYGFMTLTAALSYGELSAMFPKSRWTVCLFRLKEAFNPHGFLHGWSFFYCNTTATIAAVGVAFSKFGYFWVVNEKHIFDLGFVTISAAQLVSILLIVLLTYINTRE